MGQKKSKKKLEEVKESLITLGKDEMERIVGGKKGGSKWSSPPSCGGITPQ